MSNLFSPLFAAYVIRLWEIGRRLVIVVNDDDDDGDDDDDDKHSGSRHRRRHALSLSFCLSNFVSFQSLNLALYGS